MTLAFVKNYCSECTGRYNDLERKQISSKSYPHSTETDQRREYVSRCYDECPLAGSILTLYLQTGQIIKNVTLCKCLFPILKAPFDEKILKFYSANVLPHGEIHAYYVNAKDIAAVSMIDRESIEEEEFI